MLDQPLLNSFFIAGFEVFDEISAAKASSVPVGGVYWYLSSPSSITLVGTTSATAPTGGATLDEAGERELYAPLAKELAWQQARYEAFAL